MGGKEWGECMHAVVVVVVAGSARPVAGISAVPVMRPYLLPSGVVHGRQGWGPRPGDWGGESESGRSGEHHARGINGNCYDGARARGAAGIRL